MFERSSILFKQGDPLKFTYIILTGVVNFYDEDLPLDSNFMICDKKCASLLDTLANLKNKVRNGIGSLNKGAIELVENGSPGQRGKGVTIKDKCQLLETVQVIKRDDYTDLKNIAVDETTEKLMAL